MLKKVILPLVVCSMLLGGVASAGIAGAAVPTAVTATTPGKSAHPAKSAKQWLTSHRSQVRRVVVSAGAKAIGVTRRDLVNTLRTGKTISEVAAEHDVKTSTVVTALVKSADTEMAKAVANHRLTSTEASKLEARVPGLVAKLVNHQFKKT